MLPLSGLRILTIEQYGAAPYCSMFLANMGAEVIKIENPSTGGDFARSTGPFFLGEADSLGGHSCEQVRLDLVKRYSRVAEVPSSFKDRIIVGI